ncbi:MAG: GNAT family N-acetyltransferase [Gammaproteobacteria bacterium]|nr:GNAT family N-acetyltransferase [Gammaproteobacteria bacterium]
MTKLNLKIKLLADCSQHIPTLAQLWFNEIGREWIPHASVARAERTYREHTNSEELPLTFVAIHEDKPVGMVSLRDNDGIREDLTPWLGSLIVHPDYRRQGIGEKLVEIAKSSAKIMGYQRLYLFALDPSIPDWYEKLGWKYIGTDDFYQHTVTVMEIAVNR